MATRTPHPLHPTQQALRKATSLSVVVALFAVLVACDTPQTTFEPRSDAAGRIHTLYVFITVAASIVGFLVLVAMAYILIKFRSAPGRKARQIHGHTALEITWTILPILVLIAVAIPTVIAIAGSAREPRSDALHVTAIGHQWWFEFRYPGLGPDGGDLITANELRVPVGRQVAIDLESKDVIHSFWVPQLIGKTDMVPGRHNKLEAFIPNEIGEFYGQCAEFCGSAHALMRFRVHVDSLANFDQWVDSMRSEPPEPTDGTVEAAGKGVFQLAGGCAGCHAVQGVSTGTIGPNLTLFGDRTTVGAGILPSSNENVKAWVSNVRDLKPIPEGIGMPTFHTGSELDLLTEAQVDQVVAYLKSLILQ